MKNFKIIEPELLQDSALYEKVEEGIYTSKSGAQYSAPALIAMSVEMEEGDDSQYPLEDILDKYLVHVEDFLESDPANPKYIFGGDLDGIRDLKGLVGKRVYNEEFEAEDGRRLIKLVIEPAI